MSARYIVREKHEPHVVPRCDLPGSPYLTRKAAKRAAAKLPATTEVVAVKRRIPDG
ncbi:hypothetical protein [Kushneria aurantia]|uniref:Uncharacterized protein n=1 Tax=Kushneria aurantia TaxID=504092 RepID=A0ABV6G4G2_9GAMM|nr:hypothetical protein [Kushneria aurantia]